MKNSDMPAMPLPLGSETVVGQEGLTKREMFSMHFMQAWIQHHGSAHDYGFNAKVAARSAIECADALLSELEQQK